MSESREYQSAPAAAATPVPPALRHLLAVAQEMRETLADCQNHPHHPHMKTVHQLRTGTRRVEATLETLAREAGTRGLGAATEQVRQRWLRQLKKVRRAAGAVRDLDVHRDVLAQRFLPEKEADADQVTQDLATAAAAAHDASPLIAQARSLEAWLAAQRDTAAEALRAALHGREQKLEQIEQQFVAAFSHRRAVTHKVHRPAALLALEDYLRLMDAHPHLDAENLHDFRKGAKKARYVAESAADDDAAAAIVKAIKRVQDAIGDWHDWLVLAGEAEEALGAEGAALHTEIERRVHKEYERALRITAIIGRKLVGEWQAQRGTRRSVRVKATPRKPAAPR